MVYSFQKRYNHLFKNDDRNIPISKISLNL